MRIVALLFIVLLLGACSKEFLDVEALGNNAGIVGTWVEDEYRGDTLILNRAGDLDDEKYGFTLEEDGRFIERKNSGWCATPPVSLDNFEGTWEAVSDSLLDITVAYWGGMMTYQIRIVSLGNEDLVIKYLYTLDRADNR